MKFLTSLLSWLVIDWFMVTLGFIFVYFKKPKIAFFFWQTVPFLNLWVKKDYLKETCPYNCNCSQCGYFLCPIMYEEK